MKELIRTKWHITVIALVAAILAGAAFLDMFREPNKQFTAPILIAGVEFYQNHISALVPTKCKFTPTCSEYSKQAIRKYGTFRGVLKSAWRIVRCSPLTRAGGVDYP